MLRHLLIHPEINAVLGRAGHHAKILIADGNYPASSKKGPNAEVVCLNLMPGVVTCAQVLRAVLSAVPVDASTRWGTRRRPLRADATTRPSGTSTAVIREAGLDLELEPIEKWDFYEAVATPDHVLTIQTADQQRFANVLLSIGVRMD
jgi:L-fucose mutarotase